MEPYYSKNGISIYHGDCREVLPLLPSLSLIVNDPPYGTTSASWDSLPKGYWGLLSQRKCPLVITAAGSFTFTAVRDCPVRLRHRWVWLRGSKPSGFLDCKKRPLKVFEDVLVFSDVAYKFNPQKHVGPKAKASSSGHRKGTLYGKHAASAIYETTERYPLDVICFDAVDARQRVHPTEKPIAMMDYLLRTYSVEGDLVCDPTCGSGTLLAAAAGCGRKAIGIENDERYCEIAARRLDRQVLQFADVLQEGVAAPDVVD